MAKWIDKENPCAGGKKEINFSFKLHYNFSKCLFISVSAVFTHSVPLKC